MFSSPARKSFIFLSSLHTHLLNISFMYTVHCKVYSVGIRDCYKKQKMEKPLSRAVDNGEKPLHSNIFANFRILQNGFYRVFRVIG